MLLIDDILLSPLHGLLWIAREIHEAAREEQANEEQSIRTQLRNLYMMLETDRISSQEFDAEEKRLLDRMDELEESSADLETSKKLR